ncbi:MAG: hypothetical protein HYS07_04420 [Chlamydiae bacterium]|nr:hypothetical protein [Chlamydiota bacterium]MBI3277444.1 hypothetical protein [Chlamydiota bacterium]
MAKKFIFILTACISIIFILYWAKHRGKELQAPPQSIVPKKLLVTKPPLTLQPSKAPLPLSTSKPKEIKKIIHLNHPDLTSTAGEPPLTTRPEWILDETGSAIPAPPPTIPFEPSSTGFPGYSVTSTEETWQVYRVVMINSDSLAEDWSKAKGLVENIGCKIIFQTEKPIYQLRSYIPSDRWEDFKSSLESSGLAYTLEPSADVGTLAPDQSIGISITLQQKRKN